MTDPHDPTNAAPANEATSSAVIAPETLQRLVDSTSPIVHVITIATKPDIIKQAPVYRELESRGEQVLLSSADSDATLRALLATTTAHDIEVTARNLEDAFLALTTGAQA